ncbi:MAG TPA: class I SAM-dependent methyltransferase [Microvirga sp.]
MPTSSGVSLFAPELADEIVGMDPAGFTALWEVETTHFWFTARSHLLSGLIARYFPQAQSVLEIGCGNAAVLHRIAAERRWKRIAGAELHPSALAFARQRLGESAELVQMDARKIPAKDTFDVVGAFDVLEHIEEDETVLNQMAAAASQGGGIIVAVPQHPFLWSANDDIAHHVRRYRRGEMEAKMRAAGLEILFSTSYAALIMPAFIASRLAPWSRQRRAKDIVDTEFRISPLANRVLGVLTRAEVLLSLRGTSWPYGGSRIVVAQKRG